MTKRSEQHSVHKYQEGTHLGPIVKYDEGTLRDREEGNIREETCIDLEHSTISALIERKREIEKGFLTSGFIASIEEMGAAEKEEVRKLRNEKIEKNTEEIKKKDRRNSKKDRRNGRKCHGD